MSKQKPAGSPPDDFNIKIYPQIEKEDKKTGKMKKYYVVPDDIFDEHLKELPDGTYNESRKYRAFNGGKLYQIGSDPEKDAVLTRLGAEASNRTQAQRRTFAEDIKIVLGTKSKNGRTVQENIVTAMAERADLGDVKAAQFLRDTIGEKPAEAIDLSAEVTTEADRALMEKLKARLDHNI